MSTNNTLYSLLSDHASTTLSTSLAPPASYPKRDTRYGTLPTDYTFTSQYSYIADFGLMFYNVRWYDPYLNHFTQPDTIVPGRVQGWDRYAYVNNAPTRFTDPSGHFSVDEIRKYLKNNYGDNWEKFWDAWQKDKLFWSMLLVAEIGDDLQERNGLPIHTSSLEYSGRTIYMPATGVLPYWSQPQYDYSQGYPVDTGAFRVVTYGSPRPSPTLDTIENVDVVQIIVGTITQFVEKPAWIPVIGQVTWGLGALSYLNNGPLRIKWSLQVSYVNPSSTVPKPQFFSSPLDSPIPQPP